MEKRKREIKEQEVNPAEDTGEEIQQGKELSDADITIQGFMDDMQLIGNQMRSGAIKKPNFDYGQTAITNYLLWLIYAQMKMMNAKLSKLKGVK